MLRSMATPIKRQRAYSDANDDNGEPALKRVASVTDDTLGRLSRLLDLSSTTSPQDTLSRFSAIAKILLHETRLQVTSALPHHGEASSHSATSVTTEYELLEIEFYLWKADSHEDPFTHGSEEQRRSGRWYVSSSFNANCCLVHSTLLIQVLSPCSHESDRRVKFLGSQTCYRSWWLQGWDPQRLRPHIWLTVGITPGSSQLSILPSSSERHQTSSDRS